MSARPVRQLLVLLGHQLAAPPKRKDTGEVRALRARVAELRRTLSQ